MSRVQKVPRKSGFAGVIILLLAAGLSGCSQEAVTRSGAVTSVDPATASPGAPVRVTTDVLVFRDTSATRVEIGGQTAQIIRVIRDTEAEVLVPAVEPGAAEVRVVERDQEPGDAGHLDVIPAMSQRLVLSFDGQRVALVFMQPSAGGFVEGGREGGRRMSFDVLDVQDRLLFTQAVNHPTLGRREVHDEPAPGTIVIRPAPPVPSATFAVKMPNFRTAVKVRFFDVASGIDLDTAGGRAARVLLNEITIGG